MATIPFPEMPLIDGTIEGYQNDSSIRGNESLLWGNAPQGFDQRGTTPGAPEFARLVMQVAKHQQAPSLSMLREALIGDVVQLLEAKGSLQDGYTAVETLRNLLEHQDELRTELIQVVFRSLGATLPGATDPVPASALAAQLKRLAPRLTLPEGTDLLGYVTTETPLGGTGEPQTSYSRLGELRAVLADLQQRLRSQHGQEVQAQAVSALLSSVNQAMSTTATSHALPRGTVAAFALAYRLVMQPLEGFVDLLMLAVVGRFVTPPHAEELAHQFLKPINTGVLTGIERAAQRMRSEESAVFTTVIRPALQAELIRSSLTANESREVSLRPAALTSALTGWSLRDPLVRRAIFGSEPVYSRWLAIAQAMERAQGRRDTPLFTALGLGSLPEGERAGVLEFAPQALAHVMSDPASARALLFALQSPQTLKETKIALQLQEASIEEMAQGEERQLT